MSESFLPDASSSETSGDTIARHVHVLILVLVVEELDVKRLCKLLAQIVRANSLHLKEKPQYVQMQGRML